MGIESRQASPKNINNRNLENAVPLPSSDSSNEESQLNGNELNETNGNGFRLDRKYKQERMNAALDFISHNIESSLLDGYDFDDEEEKNHSITRGLMQILKPSDFDKVGSWLKLRLNERPVSREELLNDSVISSDLPQQVLNEMISGFEETGYVVGLKGEKIKLSGRGRESRVLGYDSIKSSLLAEDILNPVYKHRRVQTMRDVELHHLDRPEMLVDQVRLDAQATTSKVLYLTEILAGNNTSDIGFLRRTIKEIKKLPDEMKPDVIVVSGLMEGSHKFRNKDARLGLTLGLSQQFASAKLILEEVQNVGAKVIYVVSNNDRDIARDGTIESMREIQHLAQPLPDSQKRDITYWEQDQLKQKEAWDQAFKFQLDVVLPYCIKSGRRLRSADEVEILTKGNIRMEEYLMLWEAYQLVAVGQKIPERYKKIINTNNILFPGNENSNFRFTDGLDLTLASKTGRDITHMIRESLKFGDKPMYQNPTDAAESVKKQLVSDGQEVPRILSVLDQQQGFGIGGDGGWVIFTPGFTEAKKVLKQKGTIARAGSSAAWRQVTTRKIMGEPSATQHEITDDGRHIVTVFDSKLLDKSVMAPRSTIATFTDWQTGSTTARPDLQVKFADIFLDLLKDRPTYLFTDGDMIQGRNYKGMPEENAHVGLVRIEDQQMFVKEMLERSFSDIKQADLENLLKVGIVPGNHEWNSGYVLNGAIFNLYLTQIFQEIFTRNGIIPDKQRIKAYESALTKKGEYFKAWTAVEKNIAGYGLIAQHMMLEKGGKGGSGRPPVFQAQSLFEGQGDSLDDVDLGIFGHWHHPQYAQFGHKLAVVSPSLAGLSGFEWARGFRPSMGGTLIHLGGGLPLQVEFLNTESLNKHEVANGYFRNANLKKQGFKDDNHFDASSHGWAERRRPKSALQKALWKIRDDIIFDVASDMGA